MMWGYHMHGLGYGGSGLGLGLGWIFSLIFWVIIILLIVWLVKWAVGGSNYYHSDLKKPEGEKEDSAVKILKERYARGDISKEEFESKKRDLMEK